MGIYKMSITLRGAPKGGEALEWCLEKGLLGMGYGVGEPQPKNVDEAYERAKEQYGKNKRDFGRLETFITRLSSEDYVWLYSSDGKAYYCCKVTGKPDYKTDKDAEEHGICFCRPAEWRYVPEEFVPGCVKRAVRGKLQLIKKAENLTDHIKDLFDKAEELADRTNEWASPSEVAEYLGKEQGSREFFNLVDSDELEDIVCIRLQCEGWRILKSSCYKSNPHFECLLQRQENGRTQIAGLQVKAGESIHLPDFEGLAQRYRVYLFSTGDPPYVGATENPNIVRMQQEEVLDFATMHPEEFPRSVRLKANLALARR